MAICWDWSCLCCLGRRWIARIPESGSHPLLSNDISFFYHREKIWAVLDRLMHFVICGISSGVWQWNFIPSGIRLWRMNSLCADECVERTCFKILFIESYGKGNTKLTILLLVFDFLDLQKVKYRKNWSKAKLLCVMTWHNKMHIRHLCIMFTTSHCIINVVGWSDYSFELFRN